MPTKQERKENQSFAYRVEWRSSNCVQEPVARVVGRSQIKPHSVTMATENGRDIAATSSSSNLNPSSIQVQFLTITSQCHWHLLVVANFQ